MPNRDPIRPLADNVINQIAAGEVIERPASIVKELLENSLDAGATRITVDAKGGGIELIRIRDDGHGIPPEQLALALSRHCTSKLVDAAQLASIGSLGFRGEALASIAAVAHVSITSRAIGEAHGWRVETRPGGELTLPTPLAHAPGTTIEVRDLFATIPVRRRFLKRARTELLHIQQFMRRAGFCYPEVGFGLIHDGRQNLSLAAPRHASSAERRWRTLFGSEFIEHARRLDIAADELHVHGWVGEPAFSRQNSDLQYVAINRRIVRDRHIAHAVRMAYDTAVEEGRHAAYALHLELPASAVDVNVHPGKAEVRFYDPRTVHDLVYAAVKQTLNDTERSGSATPAYSAGPEGQTIRGVREAHGDLGVRASHRASAPASPPLVPFGDNLLSIVADRFALSGDQTDIVVMDLHAAIGAVVRARLARGECDSRPLIIPEAIDIELSDERIDRLHKLGIELGRLGEASVALRAVPVVINEIDAGAFSASLVAALATHTNDIDALAAAAIAGFRAPASAGDCRRWFAGLSRRLLEFGLAPDQFSVILSSDKLSELFDADRRR